MRSLSDLWGDTEIAYCARGAKAAADDLVTHRRCSATYHKHQRIDFQRGDSVVQCKQPLHYSSHIIHTKLLLQRLEWIPRGTSTSSPSPAHRRRSYGSGVQLQVPGRALIQRPHLECQHFLGVAFLPHSMALYPPSWHHVVWAYTAEEHSKDDYQDQLQLLPLNCHTVELEPDSEYSCLPLCNYFPTHFPITFLLSVPWTHLYYKCNILNSYILFLFYYTIASLFYRCLHFF